MSFVGKYVCYGNGDGGFCWGKISAEVKINTSIGIVDAFILVDRMTCDGAPYGKNRVRYHARETLVRCDKLNLETDVVERGILEDLSDEDLFLLTMGGKPELKNLKERKMVDIVNSIAETGGAMDAAGSVLKSRLQK